MSLYSKSACELSKMLKNKECSSEEITKSVFERIEQTEDKVCAYITLTKETALEKARLVDEKIAKGEELSDLAGIPVGIKDNICTKNVLTTCASKMLYNFKPPYDATVMNKVNANDMVITGKLNMDEFAMGSSTERSYFHKTFNPHNLERVPGGSSGGSAAAVAAGSAIVALGSDTGGSVRQPASCCGVYGLKPTYGSVSRYGLIAYASSLDQIGTLGRTTKDVAMLYDVVKGYDKLEETSAKRDYIDFANNIKDNIKGIKIGIPKEFYGDGVDDEVKEAVNKAVKQLESCGAEVIDVSLPSTKHGLSAYYMISSAEAAANLGRFDGIRYGYKTEKYDDLFDMYCKTRSEGFGPEVKRRIMLGTFVLSSEHVDAYYKKAKQLQIQIEKEYIKAFEKCDVLITPTSPSTAFKIGENINDTLKMYAADVCTVTVNIAGVPAISLPCGKGSDGLPIGMQIIGPKFSEQVLFTLSDFYENNFDGSSKIADIK